MQFARPVVALFAVVASLVAACSPYTPVPLAGAERQQALDAYSATFAEKLAATWNPRQALRDYPNQVLAAGQYTTVLWVIVDELGDVVITDVARSARDYLDREALRAVHVAEPFEAPPKGLLYRSSRGLVAGFPVQFTVNVGGEAGSYVQNRFNVVGQASQTQKPGVNLVADL